MDRDPYAVFIGVWSIGGVFRQSLRCGNAIRRSMVFRKKTSDRICFGDGGDVMLLPFRSPKVARQKNQVGGVNSSDYPAYACLCAGVGKDKLRGDSLDRRRRRDDPAFRTRQIRFCHLFIGIYVGEYGQDAYVKRSIARIGGRGRGMFADYYRTEYVGDDVRGTFDAGDAFFGRHENKTFPSDIYSCASCRPRAHHRRTLSFIPFKRISRSVGIAARGRVSIDTIPVRVGKRRLVWNGVVQISSEIPFFAFCRKRFYSFDHRGRIGFCRYCGVVSFQRDPHFPRDQSSVESGRLFFFFVGVGHYAGVWNTNGDQCVGRQRQYTAYGIAVAVDQFGQYVADYYDVVDGDAVFGFGVHKRIAFQRKKHKT